jgi:hypothetical protein
MGRQKKNVKSTKDAAIELGLSRIRVQKLALQGRIRGAYQIGSVWCIPSPVVVEPRGRGPVGVAGPYPAAPA